MAGGEGFCDPLLQGRTFQQLHGNEVAAVILVDFVNSVNIGMIQGGSSPGFASESLKTLGVSSRAAPAGT